jgi:hypothetical protein
MQDRQGRYTAGIGVVRLRGMQSFRVAQWEVWVLQNSLLARVERSAIAKLRRITYKVEIVHKVHLVCSIRFMVPIWQWNSVGEYVLEKTG